MVYDPLKVPALGPWVAALEGYVDLYVEVLSRKSLC